MIETLRLESQRAQTGSNIADTIKHTIIRCLKKSATLSWPPENGPKLTHE